MSILDWHINPSPTFLARCLSILMCFPALYLSPAGQNTWQVKPTTGLLSTCGIQISLLVNTPLSPGSRSWRVELSCGVRTGSEKHLVWSDPEVVGQEVWTPLLVTLYIKWLLHHSASASSQLYHRKVIPMKHWSPQNLSYPPALAPPCRVTSNMC